MSRLSSYGFLAGILAVFGTQPVSGQEIHGLDAEAARWHEAVGLRRQLAADSVRPAARLRLAVIELSLGWPERAYELLSHDSGATWPVEVVSPLLGEAAYQLERFEEAAIQFDRAASLVERRRKGVLLARAASAYELAGRPETAAERYRAAANNVPELRGWLGLREARLTTSLVRALELLDEAPAPAAALTHRIRSRVTLEAGDTVAAVRAHVEAGLTAVAAKLALSIGDSALSRVLTYEAVTHDDTAVVRVGLELASGVFPPVQAGEHFDLARAFQRLRSYANAAEAAANAAASDTTATDILVFWADVLELAGDRAEALATYGRAAAREGESAQIAAFRYGRLLVRMRRTREANTALTAFSDRFPESPNAPVAVYLVAEGLRRLRRTSEADSVYRVLAGRWPRSSYAARARASLASAALEHGDTVQAVEWYRTEVELGGPQRFEAQYRVASLTADSLERRGLLAVLARVDSIGYYGTIARQAAQLPPLNFSVADIPPVSREVSETLQMLDLLREAYLFEEAGELVGYLMAQRTRPPVQLLEYAEGLIERGYVSEGVNLGWLATRAYTLNHPRVIRVVFPWPFREIIEEEASEQGLDPYLLAALIRQESAFRPAVVSRAGAHGLMQLMPATARQLAQRLGLTWDRRMLVVADANLHLGAVHFASLLERYGAVEPALAAYNAGGTPVRRWLRNPKSGDPVQFIAQVTYPETRGYLRTVTRNRALYRALYPPDRAVVDGTP